MVPQLRFLNMDSLNHADYGFSRGRHQCNAKIAQASGEQQRCYNPIAYREGKCAADDIDYRRPRRRGVAQPGRAPGSGPGGRRFKSSLPDQYFQTLKQHFWFSVYIDGVDFVDGPVFLFFQSKLNLIYSRRIEWESVQDYNRNTARTVMGNPYSDFTNFSCVSISESNSPILRKVPIPNVRSISLPRGRISPVIIPLLNRSCISLTSLNREFRRKSF
jgi:hypothetical protein